MIEHEKRLIQLEQFESGSYLSHCEGRQMLLSLSGTLTNMQQTDDEMPNIKEKSAERGMSGENGR